MDRIIGARHMPQQDLTEINRVLCEAYKLGGQNEDNRWNKLEKIEKELRKHLARVGFLLDRKNDLQTSPFAEIHQQLDPGKHTADAALPLDQVRAKLVDELADLFLLVKAAAFGSQPEQFNPDALAVLENAYQGFKEQR
jgi:hypothetical protein